MKKVYIVGAKRTPIGSMLGGLRGVTAPELGATVVRQLLADTGLTSNDISEVIGGNEVGELSVVSDVWYFLAQGIKR